jgi:hypothetical protein
MLIEEKLMRASVGFRGAYLVFLRFLIACLSKTCFVFPASTTGNQNGALKV